MSHSLSSQILNVTRARSIIKLEDIQSLWSGYGVISRYKLEGCQASQVIVKHVKLPEKSQHPRGWNTQRSHQRKIYSYQVECAWYRDFSALCDESSRVPKCLDTASSEGEFLIIMEDLAAEGFPIVKESAKLTDMHTCLGWLANFHAKFMGHAPDSLWKTGTYWHLDTRPDELEALEDQTLKSAASRIDFALASSPYQTFVHGDAKLANFCFSEDGKSVAAVDFQYVGGGCGMKDLAYFIGSCLHEEDCQRYENQLLDSYFEQLKQALLKHQSNINPSKVEASWRPLFSVAWADFHRFLKGWSPEHWKVNAYSEQQSRKVISQLKQAKKSQA